LFYEGPRCRRQIHASHLSLRSSLCKEEWQRRMKIFVRCVSEEAKKDRPTREELEHTDTHATTPALTHGTRDTHLFSINSNLIQKSTANSLAHNLTSKPQSKLTREHTNTRNISNPTPRISQQSKWHLNPVSAAPSAVPHPPPPRIPHAAHPHPLPPRTAQQTFTMSKTSSPRPPRISPL